MKTVNSSQKCAPKGQMQNYKITLDMSDIRDRANRYNTFENDKENVPPHMGLHTSKCPYFTVKNRYLEHRSRNITILATRRERNKSKSRSKKRLTGYKSVKRTEYTQDSNDLKKYPLYCKTQVESTNSIRNSKKRNHHTIGREELEQTHRSRSEGSNRRTQEKECHKLKDTASDFVNTKITIRDNFEARRKEVSKKQPKNDKKGQEDQMIYTFRENKDGTDNEDKGFDKINTSVRSTYNHKTIDHSITEKTIKMSKKDLFPDNDRYGVE